jgi:heme/copper-type cytochrome/quinol oxidase subunit 2
MLYAQLIVYNKYSWLFSENPTHFRRGLGIVLLVFMVLDSQPSDNQYGLNPKPGNKGGSNLVVIIVTVIVFVAVMGMLAAIAIPAYQSYVERAKQAEVHQNQPL